MSALVQIDCRGCGREADSSAFDAAHRTLRNDNALVDGREADDHFDKLREECGVMAIYGHPDAARMTY